MSWRGELDRMTRERSGCDPLDVVMSLARADAAAEDDLSNRLPAGIDLAAAGLPATYEAARTALAECLSVDECVGWSDKAAALASYARQVRDTALEDMARRVRARAVRRAGELLEQIEAGQGARDGKRGVGGDTPLRGAVAAAAGLSKRQQVTAVRVARVPERAFENQVESAAPPTISGLAAQGKRPVPGAPPTARRAPAAADGFAGLMRAWNAAVEPERARFLAWIAALPAPGEMTIDEVIWRLGAALKRGEIEACDRGFVAGVIHQAKAGHWYPTPAQDARMRLLAAELDGDDVIDDGDRVAR